MRVLPALPIAAPAMCEAILPSVRRKSRWQVHGTVAVGQAVADVTLARALPISILSRAGNPGPLNIILGTIRVVALVL